MKKYVLDFLLRGLVALGFGPIALAVFYLILKSSTGIDYISIDEACIGIFSLGALAFVAGGLNFIYQIERLPLMVAILIHGIVLYACYLATYLVNGWLSFGTTPILVFTAIFIFGYIIIWLVIYFFIKKKTKNLNEILKQKQQIN